MQSVEYETFGGPLLRPGGYAIPKHSLIDIGTAAGGIGPALPKLNHSASFRTSVAFRPGLTAVAHNSLQTVARRRALLRRGLDPKALKAGQCAVGGVNEPSLRRPHPGPTDSTCSTRHGASGSI
ncbi:hypothetical protein EVAR_74872_1 [Eumeta japonica]|uniref:Uncharacterized protein n=1 Tax=Eumeta variegata TaxID=151549 RepID=A0A4C1SQ96_EUMVA|nr:hypothetical protein EVAR_74872_1 [Eumeta japonica]